jgi:hypothetical protein
LGKTLMKLKMLKKLSSPDKKLAQEIEIARDSEK